MKFKPIALLIFVVEDKSWFMRTVGFELVQRPTSSAPYDRGIETMLLGGSLLLFFAGFFVGIRCWRQQSEDDHAAELDRHSYRENVDTHQN